MANKKIPANYTELTHQVVHESPEPLPVVEIMRQVAAIAPITTRNPKSTIRNAIGQSRLIVSTGDGRYGWKPRRITGSVLRLSLSDRDLAGKGLELGDEVRDALWPAFFESQKRGDRRPVLVQLPDGSLTQWPLEHFVETQWGTTGSPEFWRWFKKLKARPRDHLIITVQDCETRRYRVTFERRAKRDEAAIALRNQTILNAVLALVRRRPDLPPVWDITSHLLATGQYWQAVPPDPLSEIWTPDIQELEARQKGLPALIWLNKNSPILMDEANGLVEQLFGPGSRVYDLEQPPELPAARKPGPGRKPVSSSKGRDSETRVFCLRVNHRGWPKVWRDIELLEQHTLEDLHIMIQRAFGWGDDHLYSFFMSGRAWDAMSEIGSRYSDSLRYAHKVRLASLELKPRQRFLYLFDYGDGHQFNVTVREITTVNRRAKYPRLAAQHGLAPEQYPPFDEA